MKNTIVTLCGVCIVATLLSGCGQSKPETATADQKPATPTSAPAAAAPPASATPAAATAAPATPDAPALATAQTTAAATPSSDASAAAAAPTTPSSAPAQPAPSADSSADLSATADAASQLVTTAKAQGDTVLSSVSSDLADKVKSLAQSASGNSALKTQLTSSLKSLAGGNDSSGLTGIYQTVQSASLTPPQMALAKEVGNLASAYVVQRNFASLDGAQSDVATIVNSLRQGKIAPAIPVIQKVAQNANLTATQKQLMASIADKYAPGISKAAGALGQGLQSIPGLGK